MFREQQKVEYNIWYILSTIFIFPKGISMLITIRFRSLVEYLVVKDQDLLDNEKSKRDK